LASSSIKSPSSLNFAGGWNARSEDQYTVQFGEDDSVIFPHQSPHRPLQLQQLCQPKHLGA